MNADAEMLVTSRASISSAKSISMCVSWGLWMRFAPQFRTPGPSAPWIF